MIEQVETMAYSSSKLYQRTTYDKLKQKSYDRLLKEQVAAGTADPKESVLEKPYKSKTYATMQQEYNPVLPPTVDPGAGTGGFKCIWINSGCDQLIGCWAGSDIDISGPDASNAGYLAPEFIEGELVKWEVSGSENRGIEILVANTPRRNTFTVKFRDGNGVIYSEAIDIECSVIDWNFEETFTGYVYSTYSLIAVAAGSKVAYTFGTYVAGFLDVVSVARLEAGSWTTDNVQTAGSMYYALRPWGLATNGSDEFYVGGICTDPLNVGTEDGIYINTYTGSWATAKALDTPPLVSVELRNGLMRDSGGYYHFIYFKQSGTYQLYHLTNASGSWQEEAIAGTYVTASPGDCCILSDDSIQIIVDVSVSGGDNELYHVSGSWGSWSAASIATSSASYAPANSSIVVKRGTDDKIHVASTWFNADFYLRYLSKTVGGSWTTTVIDSTREYNYVYMAITDNLPHIFGITQTPNLVEWHNGSLVKAYGQFELPTLKQGDAVWDSVNNIVHCVYYSDTGIGHLWRYL